MSFVSAPQRDQPKICADQKSNFIIQFSNYSKFITFFLHSRLFAVFDITNFRNVNLSTIFLSERINSQYMIQYYDTYLVSMHICKLHTKY